VSTIVTEPSIFGRIVTGNDVEGWLLACLKKWSGTYIAELERQHGLTAGELARVRAWRTSQSYDKWPEDQLPCVIVRSVGIGTVPSTDGAGWHSAEYVMQLDNVVSARTEEQSHKLAMLYAAAHGALVLQRPSLDGQADGVRWLADDYTQQAFESRRTLACATTVIQVKVENVVNSRSGPTTPNDPLAVETDPWADWPTVQTHDEQIQNQPIGGGS